MTYDFWDANVFSGYLSDVLSQRQMDAFLDDSVEVTVEDKIITLSTGVTGQSEKGIWSRPCWFRNRGWKYEKKEQKE